MVRPSMVRLLVLLREIMTQSGKELNEMGQMAQERGGGREDS